MISGHIDFGTRGDFFTFMYGNISTQQVSNDARTTTSHMQTKAQRKPNTTVKHRTLLQITNFYHIDTKARKINCKKYRNINFIHH